MDRIKFQFLKALAIFTLKNDLNATEGQINHFEQAFEKNVTRIGAEMLKQIEASQQESANNKTSNYIKNY